ncbi:MAG: gamma-glutamyl-gamma-aminobutyrate hydrolase family protein [Pseudomonadota bacterium]|nr:gamma-glutamyl-gamma-aminobutyrate hydrolase family protein [Pseudomonadota bacterium]
MSQKDIYLGHIEEFNSYGIKKDIIIQSGQNGNIAKILLPKEMQAGCIKDAPTIGFLLGQDKSENGEDYYTISKSYLQALLNTGVNIRFLDYENPYKQMNDCDAVVLPGGVFNNPESFYIDGKILGDKVGKRYFAYRAVIAEAYKKHKPMLGICAGAQMIGALLGNMKMYRDLKSEVVHPAIHKPKAETDVRIHQIKLLKGTPIFDIMGIKETNDRIMINSRHSQSMVHSVLQDYVVGSPKVKMDIYAVSDSDNIPEIWGNKEAGILCIQGHPEDLVSDVKMQNLYNYIARKAKEYKTKQNFLPMKRDVNSR